LQRQEVVVMNRVGPVLVGVVGALIAAGASLGEQDSEPARAPRVAVPGQGVMPLVESIGGPSVSEALTTLRRNLRTRGMRTASVAPSETAPLIGLTSDAAVRALVAPVGQAFQAVEEGRTPQLPESAAREFLLRHRTAFGMGRESDLAADRVRAASGGTVVRLRQLAAGLTVFGSGATVELDDRGDVVFVLSDIMRHDLDEGVVREAAAPRVAPDAAVLLALEVLQPGEGAVAKPAASPELVIYDPQVIGEEGRRRVVWKVELVAEEPPVDELVLVDAATGEVALHFSQIMTGRYREIYDGNNIADYSGSLVRIEGQGPCGIADADKAYDYFGDVYAFYSSHFGRDGIDDAGLTMKALVRYCDSDSACPYANAFWSSSTLKVSFGQGYANADDVVGHELTHGVTQFESNLIYWGESGAINEAFSDIFGEFIDLTNGKGNDSAAVRWLHGEDLPNGANRDMADPTQYDDPDRRFSSYWARDVDADDNRGVHTNCGVANKLAYLLTDGDNFNGQAVIGVGVDRAAALFYRVQSALLVPASDYIDLYFALRQAAIDLGWSAADRANLESACRAVEIAVATNVTEMFSDGFEGVFPGQWQAVDSSGVGTTWGRSTTRARTGSASAWCAAGGSAPRPPGGTYASNMKAWLTIGPLSLVGLNDAWMEFDLWLDSEYEYDYFWMLASTDDNTYHGYKISGPEDGASGWVHEVLNLKDLSSPVVGTYPVWVGFYFLSDSNTEREGAYVDNVHLFAATAAASCSYSLSSSSASFSAAGGSGTVNVTAGSGCVWTASTAQGWITITGGSPGTGSGSVAYSVAANSSASARTGTMTIAGLTFTVQQSGVACNPPLITSQPAGATVTAGTSATLSVTASGTAPLSYQWYQGSSGNVSSPVGGATSSSFTTGSIYQTTSYWVRVSNACGSADSVTATVTPSSGNGLLYLVPAAAHLSSYGANWRTDISIVNLGSTTASLTLRLVPTSGTAPPAVNLTLPAKQTKILADVLVGTMGMSWSAAVSGTLQITSDVPLCLSARTYNEETPNRTYGQYIPALTPAQAIQPGQIGVLPHLVNNDRFRTNIGIVNLTSWQSCTAVVRLFAGNGAQTGNSVRLTAAPGTWFQRSGIFDHAGAGRQDAAYATVEVETSGCSLWAYASVVDNNSDDPTTILMQVP
jgi:Zn-dependent metalloprotease